MRNTYGIDMPRARSSEVGRWVDVWAWIVAFGLLLAAPCVPDAPPRGPRAAGARPGVTAPRGDAPRPP